MTPEDATAALELIRMHSRKLPKQADAERCVYVLYVGKGNVLPPTAELWRVKVSEAERALNTSLRSVQCMLDACMQCAEEQKIMGLVFPSGETSFEVMHVV
jgi:hypothetical protein